ncbi:AAA family ATPase [Streptomyces sp. NPDC001833]|uniref:AAA family ATPase n=1 Tax=Streptomyces sp. NPDC001833 TaxID=3154658 RepID=UPI00331D1199
MDHPERDYFALETPVIAEVREELVERVATGQDVVLDHGLRTRAARDEWKKLVEEASGSSRLLHFPVPREELLRRLAECNERKDANALTVLEPALEDFYARFEPPHDEGEEIIEPGFFWPPRGRWRPPRGDQPCRLRLPHPPLHPGAPSEEGAAGAVPCGPQSGKPWRPGTSTVISRTASTTSM